MDIVLGSQSAVKITASNNAFQTANKAVNIIPIKADSGAPEQPVGNEASIGAKNRIAHSEELSPNADAYLAIESGIFAEHGKWVDRAVVALQTPSGKFYIAYSDAVEFPTDAVEEARKRGFNECTVGQVLEEWERVENNKDPHLSLTGKSRSIFIEHAIADVIQQMEADSLL